MRVTPCPSPRGTNNENLYLVRLPKSTPSGALDAALRRAKDKARDRKVGRDDQGEQDRDLTALRGKLEEFLERCLPEDHYSSAMDLLDEHLPPSKTYGEVEDEEDPEALQTSLRSKFPDHARDVRKYLADRGFSEDAIEEAISQMPKSAMEGGMGGETDDRRRGARDRGRRHAMDAAASFDAFYPWAKNIKLG
jgi:hypothetical protein